MTHLSYGTDLARLVSRLGEVEHDGVGGSIRIKVEALEPDLQSVRMR